MGLTELLFLSCGHEVIFAPKGDKLDDVRRKRRLQKKCPDCTAMAERKKNMKTNGEMVESPKHLAEETDSFRMRILFGGDGTTVLTPIAEQHFLLAVSQLESAERFFKIAHYHLMRGE